MRTRFLAGVILLTVALSVPRFGHLTPDSLWYVNLVRYFRGEARADAPAHAMVSARRRLLALGEGITHTRSDQRATAGRGHHGHSKVAGQRAVAHAEPWPLRDRALSQQARAHEPTRCSALQREARDGLAEEHLIIQRQSRRGTQGEAPARTPAPVTIGGGIEGGCAGARRGPGSGPNTPR